jgi:SAM-dependent methyltransferase
VSRRAASGSAEQVNRTTWAEPRTLGVYEDLEGWTDAGERAALARIAHIVRGRPVLELGAGAGRLASMLRLLSDDYTAVDYTPAMVEAFTRNHPDLVAVVTDARDLAAFDDGHFGLVVFSYNGIDAVGHDDRTRVIGEMHRVVAPGGWILLSTHNLDGPSSRSAPWRRAPGPRVPGWYQLVRAVGRLPWTASAWPRRWRNWSSNRRHNERGPDWAVQVSDAHDFGILMHYIRLDAARQELLSAGFVDVEVYDSERGARLVADGDVGQVRWFHLLGYRPTSGHEVPDPSS